MKKIRKILCIAIVLYLAYFLCTGVFPFLRVQPVSEEFAATVEPTDFYGAAPCMDRVALIEAPEAGLAARLHILDEAEERIDVSYYAIHMGESTAVFLGALLDAADRGVSVRILVD